MIRLLLCLLLSGMLVACGGGDRHKSKAGKKRYVVAASSVSKMLYFNGTIQPLSESTLTNQFDAVVEKVSVQYGQRVQKGEIVFTLNSSELQKQYNDTLTEYLKAKDNYEIARAKFSGTMDLWKSGLLSKNNYMSEQSSLNTARISLMQATHKLTDMLEKMGDSTYDNLSTLSFSQFEKVRQILASKHHTIYVRAPNTGVLLYPPKTADDHTKRITVGVGVKAGQVLGLIGNLSGIHVEIDIPEVDIDKVKPGAVAVVRCVTDPHDALHGRLVSINAEASSGNSAALPSFTGIVEVSQLTPQQQAWLRVGMSAAIELSVEHKNKLLIPIAAIQQVHGQSVVQLQTKQGKIINQVITTGAAEVDRVAVDSGLKIGDVIVYD